FEACASGSRYETPISCRPRATSWGKRRKEGPHGGARGVGGPSPLRLNRSSTRKEVVIFHKAYMVAVSALLARAEREEGQALVEYALILAMISVISILILQALGLSISGVLNTVNTQLSAVHP